jgi:hypothetical protein
MRFMAAVHMHAALQAVPGDASGPLLEAAIEVCVAAVAGGAPEHADTLLAMLDNQTGLLRGRQQPQRVAFVLRQLQTLCDAAAGAGVHPSCAASYKRKATVACNRGIACS